MQLAAKLALWGLSRQELPADLVAGRCSALLRALLPALALDNKWQVRLPPPVACSLPWMEPAFDAPDSACVHAV